jgi:hypothetical protein
MHNWLLSIAVEWGIPLAALLFLANLLSIKIGYKTIKYLNVSKANEIPNRIDMMKSLVYGSIAVSVAYFIHGNFEIVPPVYVFFNLGIVAAINNISRTREN